MRHTHTHAQREREREREREMTVLPPSQAPKQPEAEHQHKAAKSEPLDNRVLRAFGRVTGARYRVKNGEEALEQLRTSANIRSVRAYAWYRIDMVKGHYMVKMVLWFILWCKICHGCTCSISLDG